MHNINRKLPCSMQQFLYWRDCVCCCTMCYCTAIIVVEKHVQKNVPCLPLLLWRSKLYMFHQHLPLDISLKYMLFKYTRGSGLETSEKFPLVNVITIYTRGYFKNTVESNFSESGSCVLWWSNWFTNNHSCIKNVITKAVLQTVENDPPTWKYSFKNAGAYS